MRLDEMFAEQKDFQKNFFDPDNLNDSDKEKLTKETILCVHKELSEVLDTVNWKTHKHENKAKNLEDTKEEIVDCFKYVLNLCVIWNITPEEFMQAFRAKSKIVRERLAKNA